ncbi:magnesium chelatase subunit D, partial [Rhodobacterales bacterium HKCCE3408]|nr:magnesium chelatase subunit D [Rhodobacterales bacterium HKCCE3408]
GGVVLRARSGPVRDAVLNALRAALGPLRRVPVHAGDEALFGGVDIAATLAAGRVLRTTGLLAQGGCLVLPMAERASPGMAARLAGALDSGGMTLIALDEGAEDGEAVPAALAERLAIHLDLTDLRLADAPDLIPDAVLPGASEMPDALSAEIVSVAAALGIGSLRAPILAIAVAKALARADGAAEVSAADATAAVELVLVPRATQVPQAEEEDESDDTPPPEPDSEPQDDPETRGDQGEIPQEILLEAAKAMLPPDLLDRLVAKHAARAAQGAGAGAKRRGNRRGRPFPARPGRPGTDARIDLVATLRAAAPWQTLRKAAQPNRVGIHVAPSDIRLRQFEERSDRAIVFAVDASGSSALARLAEAKGAVELLLAQAYARRDHVALIAFRGTGADLLLPPTRSLVQTKRRLAALPGGGGTPLAAGLQQALALGMQLRGRGMSPVIAVLTDGRANVGLDGAGGREHAAEDAAKMARQIRAAGMPAMVIDTGHRPTRGLDHLAAQMGAGYLPLPRADSARLSAAIDRGLPA